jgi:hypothetical protein
VAPLAGRQRVDRRDQQRFAGREPALDSGMYHAAASEAGCLR